MGHRLALEVVDWLKSNFSGKNKGKVFFSVIGHSLGGLIAQFAVYLLFCEQKDLLLSLGLNLIPCSLLTVCTPHLGARRVPHGGSSLIQRLRAKMTMTVASQFLGQTGWELMLCDDSDIKNTILFKMAQRYPFKQSFDQFKCSSLACLFHDGPVGFCSAAITGTHPEPEILKIAKLQNQSNFLVHSAVLAQEREVGPTIAALLQKQSLLQSHPVQISEKIPLSVNAQEEDLGAPGSLGQFLEDSLGELEYHPEMLAALEESTKRWNVYYLHFHAKDLIAQQFVHPLVVGKTIWGISPESRNMAMQSAGFLADLVVAEFQDSLVQQRRKD